jgi:chemotaxis protein histidine kinase CheA
MADILAQAQAVEPAAVDSTPDPVVKSGYSVFQQEVQAVTDHSDQKAAKAAEREAAKAAREAAKAAAAAEKQAKAEARAQAQAAKESEKLAKAQARADARAAKEAAAATAAQSGVYVGSMLALRDARARYVKAMNGRLRSTDDIATVFDAVEPRDVVAIALEALQLGYNPYTRLNIGQQSMNLRNRLRGALKKGYRHPWTRFARSATTVATPTRWRPVWPKRKPSAKLVLLRQRLSLPNPRPEED